MRVWNCCSDCVVESDGWTTDLSEYRQWLDGVQLTGGGRSDSAMAEGLQEAVFLFQRPSQRDMKACQNHIVLLMATEPHRLLVHWPFGQAHAEVSILAATRVIAAQGLCSCLTVCDFLWALFICQILGDAYEMPHQVMTTSTHK